MSNIEEDINKAAVGHCFGNFHQYYSFHKAEDRMNLLPINFFNQIWKENGQRNQFRLLDIGCNDGTLTWALFQRARMELPEYVDISVTGIDLDSELIDRANASFVTNENKKSVKFKAIDIINHQERNEGDTDDHILNGTTFDLVSLFSITMWVHLNHGDKGFVQLIETAARYSLHSVLIEPQRWKSYRTAIKRGRRLGTSAFPFSNADLKLKDVDIAVRDIFTSISNEFEMWNYLSLGTDSWERPLLLYQRSIVCPPPPYDD